MPGVASAAGSGIWSRRRDEITFDRLQKVPSRALCFVRSLCSIWVMWIGARSVLLTRRCFWDEAGALPLRLDCLVALSS
jgi:hypothetical protein